MKIWLLLLGLLSAWPAAAAGPILQRGVNLSHWLQYGGRQSVSATDMDMLRRAGFDHVRLPVDPARLGWRPERPGDIPEAARLRGAIALAVNAGLDVILDVHPDEAFKRALENDDWLEPAFMALWQELARQTTDFPTDKLAFELLNEPQYYGHHGKFWWRLQSRLVKVLHAAAPGRLLLLSGPEGSSVEALIQGPPPVTDAVYVFHFYQPYIFTHQGAEWMADAHTAAASMHDLPYPAARVAEMPQGRAAAEVARYRSDNWNADRIRHAVAPVAAWGRSHGVRVMCTEFGVLRSHVDAASRYGWITDARRAFEQLGMGWTVWDYSDVFGIASGQPRRLDDGAPQALGLVEVGQ